MKRNINNIYIYIIINISVISYVYLITFWQNSHTQQFKSFQLSGDVMAMINNFSLPVFSFGTSQMIPQP